MDLKESDILGDRIGDHWYYGAKAKAMEKLLGEATPRVILDVGAGSGFFSKYLVAKPAAREAWCVDISYPRDSDESLNGKPIHYRRAIDAVNADLVLFMDVLEHVDDDVGLLQMYVDKVPSGSLCLITVPAFTFLWSDHDEFLEHKRRYRLAQVEEVVRATGLEIIRSAYYFGAILPLVAAIRLAQRAKPKNPVPRSQMTLHHPLVNTALKATCAIELPFMNLNRVAGLSVFCLGRKP